MKSRNLKFYFRFHDIALVGALAAAFGFGGLIQFNKKMALIEQERAYNRGKLTVMEKLDIRQLSEISVGSVNL